MILTNRFDKLDLVESIDDTAFKSLTYSYEGTRQTVDAEINAIIPESRYIILENMLFSVTDYDQSRGNTKITAIDFVHKIAETKDLSEQTYTLLDLLKLINKNATVTLSGAPMPETDINDGTTLNGALDDLINTTSAYITIETTIDFTDATLYNVHANVLAINPDMFNKVDDVVLIDDIDTVRHFNPQLDLAKRINFGFSDINDKNALKTWKSKVSASDYDALLKKIDGGEDAITDKQTHDILAKAITFKKSVFTKNTGDLMINNDVDIVDDGIPYDLGSVAFATYNQVVSTLINTLLSEFKQVDYPTRTLMGDLHQFRIVGIDGNALYRATKLDFDLKRRVTTSLTMLLADYFEEVQ
jgi:hypothetical protein